MSIRAYLSKVRRPRRLTAVAHSLATPLGDIAIRPAQSSDVNSIVSMVEKSCRLHENWDDVKFGLSHDAIARYRNWLARLAKEQDGLFLIARNKEKNIGYLVGTIDSAVPIYRVLKYGYVRDLWVEEKFRGTGIGREMLSACIGRFKESGVSQVRLETASANEAARKFFSRCGFRPCSTEMLIGL